MNEAPGLPLTEHNMMMMLKSCGPASAWWWSEGFGMTHLSWRWQGYLHMLSDVYPVAPQTWQKTSEHKIYSCVLNHLPSHLHTCKTILQIYTSQPEHSRNEPMTAQRGRGHTQEPITAQYPGFRSRESPAAAAPSLLLSLLIYSFLHVQVFLFPAHSDGI